jgi:molybdopterin-guanine dinucleotide biosynthesis protein A
MNISAVLLAGGESQRMGKDKATIIFRGQALWQTQLDLLRKLNPAEIFISAKIDPIWRPNECKFVADEAPSRGPLSGITAALNQTRSSHLLVLAIDMPFMNAAYLRSLCDLVAPGCGVVSKIDNLEMIAARENIRSRFESLAAIYPRKALVDFRRALTSDDFSLQTLTARLIESAKLRATPVADEARKYFQNLNEPSDLEDEAVPSLGSPSR